MRQSEAETLAKTCDAMVVIGAKHSANSRHLYEICRRDCENVQFIENAAQLDRSAFHHAETVKFCFGDSIEFDAKVGTDDITRVDWYFGDGTSEYYGQAQTKHAYTSPGWYDVTADLYGHQVCTDESEMFLGQVSFSFLVYRPDTLIEVQPADSCIKLEKYKKDPAYYDDLIAKEDHVLTQK